MGVVQQDQTGKILKGKLEIPGASYAEATEGREGEGEGRGERERHEGGSEGGRESEEEGDGEGEGDEGVRGEQEVEQEYGQRHLAVALSYIINPPSTPHRPAPL